MDACNFMLTRISLFKLKPTCDIQVNIDAVKFYKLNTFHENVFFEQPALIYTLVEKDKLALRPMFGL